MTREIDLGGGAIALVDDADYEWLSDYPWRVQAWRLSRTRYAGLPYQSRYTTKTAMMHRLITGAVDGEVVDHINGDGLDNRRANLRLCTHRENAKNRPRPNLNNRSGYKGVIRKKNRWRASICTDGRMQNLGSYLTPVAAARAYDRAALAQHGAFASPNFSPDRDWIIPHEHAGQWPPTSD